MVKEEKSKLAEYLSLFALITLTVIAIANKNISVFYIIYLFWWDELIKSIFDIFRFWFKKDQINDTKVYFSNMSGRFFFLMIYFVFILVFFGFMIDFKDYDLAGLNFEVLFFMNPLFNFSLASFLMREIYLYKFNDIELKPHHVLSRGIITLHLSIILGIFLWALITMKFQSLEAYATLFSIVPFLLFKIFFEIQEIKFNHKLRQKSNY
ncbi:DUF6498-containing protein [Psychroserpens sp. Hel_I_66]|uniref:DUF6498-containing protein n=1 Tax=Psychroserpens sp. Hel_I_66 TaxID=1250004 RepID=UPI000648DE61|nr:DUF6498-containing protein [Psychroserpens sp. Hel_I_66]